MSQNAGYTVEIQKRSKICGIKPLVALIFNFAPPMGEKPSLLSFKDLQTLFRQVNFMHIKIKFKVLIFLNIILCHLVWTCITSYINKGGIHTYCRTYVCRMGCTIYF